MGWRSVIISSHAKISYSSNCMIVQTMEGINKIPIDDVYLLLISTTQAVITTELINRLNKVIIILITKILKKLINKYFGMMDEKKYFGQK